MSFWDDLGSFADTAGGWIGDAAGVAIGLSDNIAQLNSALNAVKKPNAGPKPAPIVPYTGPIGPPSGPGIPPILLLGGIALGVWLLARSR